MNPTVGYAPRFKAVFSILLRADYRRFFWVRLVRYTQCKRISLKFNDNKYLSNYLKDFKFKCFVTQKLHALNTQT